MVKFRGKTKKGKWVYGSLVQYSFLGESICSIVDESKAEHFPLAQRLCPVHPSTIAQFIGILDKNQVEIYGSIEIGGKMSEGGDIITTGEGYNYAVIWDDICSGWLFKGIGKNIYNETAFDLNFKRINRSYSKDLEVIGNQTDDKNLLA